MPKYRLGKGPRKIDSRTLRFSKYAAGLAAPPASVSWQDVTPSGGWGMDGNDTLGDCVVAASAHQIEAWSYNADPSSPENVTSQQCVSLYDKLSPNDTGLVIIDYLNGWHDGYPLGPGTDSLAAYVSLNPANETEIQQAISLFGGVLIGLELPNAIVDSVDPLAMAWDLPPGGATGPDWSPNPNNGHAVVLLGYDPANVYLITWGEVVVASWAFIQAYSDEMYALLSPDWLAATGQSPSGFDMAQLQADLSAITQTPPPPTPGPAPSECRDILTLAEREFSSGHIYTGIVSLFQYVDCVIGGGHAAPKEHIESLLERIRRKL